MATHLSGSRLLALGCALLLIACARPPAPPPPPDSPSGSVDSSQDLPAEQRSPDLFGSWLVEEIAPAGEPPRPEPIMILLVGSHELEAVSQCIRIGPFQYDRTAGGGIAVRQPPPRRPTPGSPPIAMCARGLSPNEQALAPILLAARRVERRPDGRIAISGPEGGLTMVRPVGALANPWGNAPPPPVPPALGAWRLASIDGLELAESERIELLLRSHRIEWRSGCVNQGRALHREGDRLLPGEIDPFAVCERGRTRAEEALGRLTSGPIIARMSPSGRLGLTGSGVDAEFVPLTR